AEPSTQIPLHGGSAPVLTPNSSPPRSRLTTTVSALRQELRAGPDLFMHATAYAGAAAQLSGPKTS
ncbi:hypothetical protein, partial [Nocardia abscessus]|uniref:hypothetical protein n=1 Tax=Nocardia abscessus TaxID=120957 RepID=UPI002456AE57